MNSSYITATHYIILFNQNPPQFESQNMNGLHWNTSLTASEITQQCKQRLKLRRSAFYIDTAFSIYTYLAIIFQNV